MKFHEFRRQENSIIAPGKLEFKREIYFESTGSSKTEKSIPIRKKEERSRARFEVSFLKLS